MANSTQVVTDLHEYEYLTPTEEKPSPSLTKFQTEPSSKIVRIGSFVGLIIFVLASAIPILQIYIGYRYSEECPLDWHIPHYLVVAGIIGIITVILGIIQNVLTLQISTNQSEQTPKIGPAIALGIVCLLSILLLFLFVWFIIGCVWVFRAWNKVQYIDPNETNYCHPTLYRFAYWLLLIAFIFKTLSCCHSCWKIPLEVKKLKTTRSSSTSSGP